jgi:hypothetical protein
VELVDESVGTTGATIGVSRVCAAGERAGKADVADPGRRMDLVNSMAVLAGA